MNKPLVKLALVALLGAFGLGWSLAKHGADDPPGDKRGGNDDPPGHALIQQVPGSLILAKHGADDPPGDKRGGGADDPPGHA
jgi:hypothetical protein